MFEQSWITENKFYQPLFILQHKIINNHLRLPFYSSIKFAYHLTHFSTNNHGSLYLFTNQMFYEHWRITKSDFFSFAPVIVQLTRKASTMEQKCVLVIERTWCILKYLSLVYFAFQILNLNYFYHSIQHHWN